jgi:hypothetical protein
MPTPKHTLIPIRVLTAMSLSPVVDREVIYVPTDIKPGDTKRTTGSIWLKIQGPARPPEPGQIFKKTTTIQLTAVIPHINRRLPHFKLSKAFTIQYPLSLQRFKWLHSIEYGSTVNLKWAVSSVTRRNF